MLIRRRLVRLFEQSFAKGSNAKFCVNTIRFKLDRSTEYGRDVPDRDAGNASDHPPKSCLHRCIDLRAHAVGGPPHHLQLQRRAVELRNDLTLLLDRRKGDGISSRRLGCSLSRRAPISFPSEASWRQTRSCLKYQPRNPGSSCSQCNRRSGIRSKRNTRQPLALSHRRLQKTSGGYRRTGQPGFETTASRQSPVQRPPHANHPATESIDARDWIFAVRLHPVRVRCVGKEFTQWDKRKVRHELRALPHKRLDLVQDGQHLLLFGNGAIDNFRRQAVINRSLRVRISQIEIDRDDAPLFIALDQIGAKYLPCLRSFLPVRPPTSAIGELLILQRLRLGVFSSAFR